MSTPGITHMYRFIDPTLDKHKKQIGKKGFKGFVDYIAREEAIRKNGFSQYTTYMGNSKKSHGLFTADKDYLNNKEVRQLKKAFTKAHKNNSLLHQDVFSFDNKWLEEHGLYDPKTHTVNEAQLMEAVRRSMDYILDKKNQKNSIVWAAAIHYNTDNIHIHVGSCEPIPTNSRGLRSEKTLLTMKSKFANCLIDRSKELGEIHKIIRKNILPDKNTSFENKQIRSLMKDVIDKLPKDKRHWHYNYNTMKDARVALDKLTSYYLNEFKQDDFMKLVEKLNVEENHLKRMYGEGQRELYQNYKDNKIKDLYTRMGNRFLKEIKESIKTENIINDNSSNLNNINDFKINKDDNSSLKDSSLNQNETNFNNSENPLGFNLNKLLNSKDDTIGNNKNLKINNTKNLSNIIKNNIELNQKANENTMSNKKNNKVYLTNANINKIKKALDDEFNNAKNQYKYRQLQNEIENER